MLERHARRVKRQSCETEFVTISSIQHALPVIRISNHRMSNMLQMPPHLMKSSCPRTSLDERHVCARP